MFSSPRYDFAYKREFQEEELNESAWSESFAEIYLKFLKCIIQLCYSTIQYTHKLIII